MTAATARVVDDPLKSWVETAGTLRRPRTKLSGRPSRARLRFALYGRMSTVEYQDASTSAGDGGKRTYLFTGLVLCGVCERRMDAHWLHGRPGYRCRHGARSSRLRAPRPGNVYIREDRLLRSLAEQYAGRSDAEVVAELRASNRRIVCTATGWSLTEPPSAARARPPDGALF